MNASGTSGSTRSALCSIARPEQTGFEGLPGILTSFILGTGNRSIYGRRLPAVLDRLDRLAGAASDAPCHNERGTWWLLAQLFSPVLRRAEQERIKQSQVERKSAKDSNPHINP